MSDRRPAIPPDAALAVGGRVPQAVADALAEARRIRDGWRAAVQEAGQAAAQARLAEHATQAAEWRRALEADAVHLAVALAERIVQGQPAARLGAIQAVLATARPPIVLTVHPDDAEALAASTQPAEVEIRCSGALRPGDALLSTPEGRHDGRLRARIEALLPR